MSSDWKQKVKNMLDGVEIYFDHSLKQYNTWKIDSNAEILVISKNSEELQKALFLAQIFNLKYTILGKGSNVLVPDEGISGMVIINKSKNILIQDKILNNKLIDFNNLKKHEPKDIFHIDSQNIISDFYLHPKDYNFPKNQEFVEARHKEHDLLDFSDIGSDLVDLKCCDYNIVDFDSGVDLGYAINWTHNNNMTGLQFFAGIPSTMGGALFNNIHGGDRHLSDKFALACVLRKLMERPNIILFIGPSGVGKSTMYERLLSEYPDKFEHMVSTTTREVREGEIEGVSRYFVSKEKFKEMIKNDEFIEYEELFNGHFYGTQKSELERIQNNNKIAITDIDVKGANSFQRIYGDRVVSIIIKPPSMEVLKSRLINRGDTINIDERIARSKYELSMSHKYDYSIINDDLEQTYQFISGICNSKYFFKKEYINIEQMRFGYDQSILRENKNICILKVFLLLPIVSDEISLQSKLNANTWLKRKKFQPRNSCGSVFQSLSLEIAKKHDLPVQAVGYIIDKKLNWKGKKIGGASIYQSHANFIVSDENIKSRDIKELVKLIKDEIKDKLGIEIHEEFDYL